MDDFFSESGRWIPCLLFGLFFATCVYGNWEPLVKTALLRIRRKEGSVSSSLVLPFMGPLLGLGFFLSCPWEPLREWWWLAFILEPTWVMGIYRLIRRG